MTTSTDTDADAVPSRSDAAMQVLRVIDDRNAGSRELARAIGTDPALASRTLTLANSAYYGLSGRVATLDYAVSILGFSTIRAIALSLVAGLDGPGAVPDGFWAQAAIAATAADLLAPLFGTPAPDAFCVALLHTFGSALLHQRQPLPQLCLPTPSDPGDFDKREVELYGIGHAERGAEMMARWLVPQNLCVLIAQHHVEPLPDAQPLARVLHAARTVTGLVLGDRSDDPAVLRRLMWISQGALTPDRVELLTEQTRVRSAALLTGLTSA